ncbi:hypothetical protein [Kitasatospora atroaurantiaca]|nr:hypothetical protein [Kitasatospora atroaurantiaca]
MKTSPTRRAATTVLDSLGRGRGGAADRPLARRRPLPERSAVRP